MPYVPSIKTDGKSQDRTILDAAVELAAQEAAKKITNNYSLPVVYGRVFTTVAESLRQLSLGKDIAKIANDLKVDTDEVGILQLVSAIYSTGATYGYEGAFLGELNYAITRFIQRVPQMKVADGTWPAKDEIRYWLYVATIEPLLSAETSSNSHSDTVGSLIAAVFHDIKDEYKWRVNRSYEVAQIKKSGDCYDTPYYSRVVEVVDEAGTHIGDTEIYLARSAETLGVDMLPFVLVLKKKS